MANLVCALIDEAKDLRGVVEHRVEYEEVSGAVGGFFNADYGHGMACIPTLATDQTYRAGNEWNL